MKRKYTKLLLCTLTLFISVSFAKRETRKSGPKFEEWQKRYLEKIQLLAREGGLPEEEWRGITKYDKEVCYEKQCLESALEFATATNFTVDPCQPNMWLPFVCARRVKGADNINQLESLMKKVDSQTKALLGDKSGKYDRDFLFKEAQAYYHQCKHKALNDEQDVKDILAYMAENYGEWPIFSNREPGEKFDWLDMVADLNKIERPGFKPLIFQLQVQQNDGQIHMGIGKTSFSISGDDYVAMLQKTQKTSGRKKPARLEQLKGMLQFVNSVNYATLQPGGDWEQPITIKALQQKTEEYFDKNNINMKVDWLRFFKRVFGGNGSDIKISPDTPITLPFNTIMKVMKTVNDNLSVDKKSVANALHFQMAALLLQESTILLDNLNTFKCTEQTGTRQDICLARTTEIFGYSLGKTYLKAYYDESKSTPAINKLMEKIQLGYMDAIDDTKWMENSTKAYLKDKVQSMTTFVAEPDWTKKPNGLKKFYRGFKGSKDKTSSYPLNYLSITNWVVMKKMSWAHNLGKIQASGDLSDFHIYDLTWSRYLGTVQAQFHKMINEARIEGGIVQAPLFEVGRPGYMNFGGLGMVLAHEIGHSYDQQGRMYNKHGQYGEFWDKKSVELYNKWVQQIADDYGSAAHQTSDTSAETIDPWKTMNEDISDILAIFISYHSYEEYLKELEQEGKHEKILPGLKSFTPQKLFYMKYGNMWCNKKDVQDSFNDLLGGHSSGNTRATMPLKRSKQFAEAFGCPVPEQYK